MLTVKQAALVLLGLLKPLEPVAREVGPGVRVLLALLERRHGCVEQVAHWQDTEPRYEGVGEYDVEPLEVANERDVHLQPGVHGYGVVEVLSVIDEAYLISLSVYYSGRINVFNTSWFVRDECIFKSDLPKGLEKTMSPVMSNET